MLGNVYNTGKNMLKTVQQKEIIKRDEKKCIKMCKKVETKFVKDWLNMCHKKLQKNVKKIYI